MRVFFGSDINHMLSELRSQGVSTLRCHVFGRFEGDVLLLEGRVTCFYNNQVLEAVLHSRCKSGQTGKREQQEFAMKKAEVFRGQIVERLKGFELRYGAFEV